MNDRKLHEPVSAQSPSLITSAMSLARDRWTASDAVPDNLVVGLANDLPNNVVALRSTHGSDASHGHPSGPRTTSNKSDTNDSVERAVYLRRALAVFALSQLSIALAWLFGNVPFGRIVGNPTPSHLSRDAALGVILGVIGLIVAWRPRSSLSLAPVVGAIVAVQIIGLVSDASSQEHGFTFEFPHALATIVGILIFLVSRLRRYPLTGH